MTRGKRSPTPASPGRRTILRVAATALATEAAGGALMGCGQGGGDANAQPTGPGGPIPGSPSPVPTPTPSPEVVSSIPPKMYAVWDGISGPRYLYWDQASQLAWKNPNGDWLDSKQQKQGATAYDTKTITSLGGVSFNVTALVSRWLVNSENRGFYLRGVSGAWRLDFAGRLSENPPVLTIVTSEGTFTPICTASAFWSHGVIRTSNGQQTFSVQTNGRSAIVQFDLEGITGRLISASLKLTCTWRNSNSGVGIFEADPPGYLLGGNYDNRGFADNFVLDLGIHDHPAVIATLQDWTWDNFKNFFDLYGADASSMKNRSFGTEADGTKYVRLKMPTGTQDIPTMYKYFMKAESNFAEPTLLLERDASNPGGKWMTPANGLPVHEELYCRYRIFLENDWRSTVDGGKMPGFDGRMGRWEMGKWQNVGGNSSNDSLGIKRPFSAGWAFEGHSVRGSYWPYSPTGNPNAELFPYGVYLYSLDSGYYDGIERFGNAVLTRGEWYSLEWRMKMNTLSGEADEHGNRLANPDGILQCWCDGTLVYSRTNIRWRRHPLLGVAAFYFAMYHGGTSPTKIDMHVRFANFVVSTQYIGPVKKA